MSRSPQVRLSSAMKRTSVIFSALFLVLSAFGGNALATTPISVDLYQDMESGNAGDVLTTSIMNASSHGAQGWNALSGTLWVSTKYHRDLPGPVICGGATYNGTGGTRSWMFNNNCMANYVRVSFGSYSEITGACYYTTGCTLTSEVGYDVFVIWGGGSFACMQSLASSLGPNLRLHSEVPPNDTNDSPITAQVTTGKTYWVNSKYSSSIATAIYAVFDPDNGYAQVGSTQYVASLYNDPEFRADFGRVDNHGNQTNDLAQGYFDQVMFDHTNAAFPLLPSGYNDTTAPARRRWCATAPERISRSRSRPRSCRPIGTWPLTTRAASRATSTPSARRKAAPTLRTGPR